jgi:hypothetical protein
MTEQKYDATYYSKRGKAVVHVIAPKGVSEEENQRRIQELRKIEWEVWNSFPVEKRLAINARWEAQQQAEKNGAG